MGTAVSFTLWTFESRADGFDAWWLLTRLPALDSLSESVRALLVGLVLAVDYLLNVVVIALPASRHDVQLGRSARDMIGFTILAQCIDRLGMFVAFLFVGGVRSLMPGTFTTSVMIACMPYVLLVNFALSGAFIWFLARHYLAFRWLVPRRSAVRIATLAAILTNPGWAMGIALILGLTR